MNNNPNNNCRADILCGDCLEISAASNVQSNYKDPFNSLFEEELKLKLNSTIQKLKLTPRELQVLLLCIDEDAISAGRNATSMAPGNVIGRSYYIGHGYRLNRNKLKTISPLFNVTYERIRQIFLKSIRKLRHPSRRKFIKQFYLDLKK